MKRPAPASFAGLLGATGRALRAGRRRTSAGIPKTLVPSVCSRQPLRKRRQTTFPSGPRPTRWITYSQRPKSLRRIKGNFGTWTRLGLFTTVIRYRGTAARFRQGSHWVRSPRESVFCKSKDMMAFMGPMLPSSEASASNSWTMITTMRFGFSIPDRGGRGRKKPAL
jgi:hypothetical protein